MLGKFHVATNELSDRVVLWESVSHEEVIGPIVSKLASVLFSSGDGFHPGLPFQQSWPSLS